MWYGFLHDCTLAKSATSSRTLVVRRGNWVRIWLWDITWIMGIDYWHLATASKAFLESSTLLYEGCQGHSPDRKVLEPECYRISHLLVRYRNVSEFRPVYLCSRTCTETGVSQLCKYYVLLLMVCGTKNTLQNLKKWNDQSRIVTSVRL
jgi:hypothetical protein